MSQINKLFELNNPFCVGKLSTNILMAIFTDNDSFKKRVCTDDGVFRITLIMWIKFVENYMYLI